jgi:hypothetical protein
VKASMKPIPCDSGIRYIEYYIMFHRSDSTELYMVPVSKD